MSAPEAMVIDVGALPSLEDYGYVGGRQSLRGFCARAFAPGGPRFLRDRDGALVVFRHADVRGIAAAPQLSALAPAVLFPGVFDGAGPSDRSGLAIPDLIKNQLFTTNPPLNPALRRVLLNQIGPRPTAAQADRARTVAATLLQALPTGAPIDLVRDFAEPLTGLYWGGLMDMADAEAVAAAVEARRMSPMLNVRRDAGSAATANAAATAYRSLVEGAAQRAQAKDGCPFVEGMAKDLAALEFEDDLGYGGVLPKTVGAFLAGNLFDGFHTAALAAANTLHVMLRRPDALDAVRQAPEKAAAAVAESLRLESPVIHLNRIATAEVRYGDAIIPQGTQVVLMWGAANHDPEAFPAPDRFDLERSQQGATTFGGGAHICPGRFAASLIARAALEGLLQSGLDVRPVPGAERWVDNNAMAQLERFTVTLERRVTD